METNILICDDEPQVMELVQGRLQGKGYHIWKSLNGVEIRRMINECHPSLIILEMNLMIYPGDELTRLLKNSIKTKDIPIIILSEWASDKRTALEAGADAFVPKNAAGIKKLEKEVEKLVVQKRV